jgi:DNA (cytosine-5)-methyltransferase 1
MKILDLFSGIGGFSLGLERTGEFETVAFCEIDPFCRKVLKKHWPGVPVYTDVRMLRGYFFPDVDVITGGFPCQDISVAGRQAGMGKETRSGLWDHLCRLIGEVRPRYAIVENVSALLSGPSEQRGGWFGKILGDLAEIGFDAEWHCIPASAVGAPHIRDRVWILAYPQHSNTNKPGPHRAGVDVNGGSEPADQQIRFAGPLGEILADTPGFSNSGERDHEDRGQYKEPTGKPGGSSLCSDLANTKGHGLEGRDNRRNAGAGQSGPGESCGTVESQWLPEPNVGRVAHGVPKRVDRLRSLGNAVVPQIPELIGHAILKAEALTRPANAPTVNE